MFKNVTPAPPDAIFGLMEAMRRDPRPEKVNLGAGVYKDENGQTPVLAAVKEAERLIWGGEPTKSYLPIEGGEAFTRDVQGLLLAEEHEIRAEERIATVHTPGGTGALRMLADFLATRADGGGSGTVWVSDRTWPNHPEIFKGAGLRVATYPYFDAEGPGLDFEGMMAGLGQAGPADTVVLHGCCHNPTGIDLSLSQWDQIGALLASRGALPLVDFAYHGFVDGLTEDASWLPILNKHVREMVICTSYSKNFGLYNERVGALSMITDSAGDARAVLSRIKKVARVAYSNPPAHGAAIVSTVLASSELRAQWEAELAEMRRRIRDMRRLFVAGLDERGVRLHASGNDFIARQNGMFSYSGLTPEQVERVRDQAGIYMVNSGRINVAGMNRTNMDRLCDAIAGVLQEAAVPVS